MPHHHFTLDERMFIQIGLEQHKSHRHLARELGISHTAVNYEVKHNFVRDEGSRGLSLRPKSQGRFSRILNHQPTKKLKTSTTE